MTWTQFDSYGTSNPIDSSKIMFAKSTDAGTSWSQPGQGLRIDKLGGDCVDADNTVEGAVPAVGPNGEVYVAWAGPKIRNSQFGIFLINQQTVVRHGLQTRFMPVTNPAAGTTESMVYPDATDCHKPFVT